MAEKSTGNCYLCGEKLGKSAMKNHLLKNHDEKKGGKECCLLKIEGRYDKNYWLYIDVPVEKTLSAVDSFLRKIWLECCGHLSEFFVDNYVPIKSSQKLGDFAAGEKFFHQYDFGTTTETAITVLGNIRRMPQKNVVRLLARNTPPVFLCENCGKPADYICRECAYESDNPFYCMECSEDHECGEEMLAPVTNSPRMGECGYTGEFDTFEFDPVKISGK